MEITITLPRKFEKVLNRKATESGQDVSTLVKQIVEINLLPEINGSAENQADFESDMLSFADGTADIPPYNGTYSREEIYFDHD